VKDDGTWWAVYSASEDMTPFVLCALVDEQATANECARWLEESQADRESSFYVAVFGRECLLEAWKPVLSWEEAENGAVLRA
jgi:hypothetical protein